MTTTDTQPVFTSAGQALHVAFLMEVLPPTQRVSTQILIDAMREQLGKVERRLESSINVGGLSPLELRGQCAMAISAARNHLPTPEYAAVRARFGHQRTKAAGVAELADYIQPATGVQNAVAVRALVWARYHKGSQRAADRWSLRTICAETGVTEHAAKRAQHVIRQMGDALEARADARMTELFERTGLIAADGVLVR